MLKGINLEVKKGHIYGFLGPNGAGKTTTMNILSGLIDYNQGEIFLDGVKFDRSKRELLKKVGYLPQSPIFYNYMSALEYLSFIGKVSGMEESTIKKRTYELLETVKLKDHAKRKIGGYSGGMKQRLGIAVALFNNPELIFLDEPTSALDPEGRMEILEFIGELEKLGTTVVVSTHILNDVERICHGVSIINKGEIILSDSMKNIKDKYIQPIYEVEFERECFGLKERLAKLLWVESINIDKNKALIYVKDLNKAKKELFKIIAQEENPVLSFNLRKGNLEEIYLRLVNSNGNL